MDGRDNGATASLFRLPIRIELGSVTVPYSEIQSAFISSISVTCPGLPWISGEVFWLLAPLRCVRDRFWLWLWPSGNALNAPGVAKVSVIDFGCGCGCGLPLRPPGSF